jgi:hypothetical protein
MAWTCRPNRSRRHLQRPKYTLDPLKLSTPTRSPLMSVTRRSSAAAPSTEGGWQRCGEKVGFRRFPSQQLPHRCRERKNFGQRSVDREDRPFRKREAVMEWVLKLEAQNGWGEVETIEVGRLERRVVGLTAEELGLTLAESKTLLGELGRRSSGPSDPSRGICHLRSCLRKLPGAPASPRSTDPQNPDAFRDGHRRCASHQRLPVQGSGLCGCLLVSADGIAS